MLCLYGSNRSQATRISLAQTMQYPAKLLFWTVWMGCSTSSLYQVQWEAKDPTLWHQGLLCPAQCPETRYWFVHKLYQWELVKALLFSKGTIASGSFQLAKLGLELVRNLFVYAYSQHGACYGRYSVFRIDLLFRGFEAFRSGLDAFHIKTSAQ